MPAPVPLDIGADVPAVAGIGIIGPLLIVALAGWGFWVALAGRPIFRDSLSEA